MLIWTAGRIQGRDAPLIAPADRALEHGIGLFETLRTWGGVPRLLDRHLDRLRNSARDLAVPLDDRAFPDGAAIRALIVAEGLAGDVLLRITQAGGTDDGRAGPLWMRASPLPPALDPAGIALVRAGFSLSADDPLARHKTLNYWSRRMAFEGARAAGGDDALMGTADGRVWETSRMNLFVVRDGRVRTPPRSGPILAGILRGLILDWCLELGLPAEEADLRHDDLAGADEVFLTNSVRGIVTVRRIADRSVPTDGRVVASLRDELRSRLLPAPEGARP